MNARWLLKWRNRTLESLIVMRKKKFWNAALYSRLASLVKDHKVVKRLVFENITKGELVTDETVFHVLRNGTISSADR